MSQQISWYDPYVDFLVEERRRRNEQFHVMYGRSRQEFWNSVARRFICLIFDLLLKNSIFYSNNPLIQFFKKN
jgi:hypothetical protein